LKVGYNAVFAKGVICKKILIARSAKKGKEREEKRIKGEKRKD
jgi:hypothetical protein